MHNIFSHLLFASWECQEFCIPPCSRSLYVRIICLMLLGFAFASLCTTTIFCLLAATTLKLSGVGHVTLPTLGQVYFRWVLGQDWRGFVGVAWQEGPRAGETGHPKSPAEVWEWPAEWGDWRVFKIRVQKVCVTGRGKEKEVAGLWCCPHMSASSWARSCGCRCH